MPSPPRTQADCMREPWLTTTAPLQRLKEIIPRMQSLVQEQKFEEWDAEVVAFLRAYTLADLIDLKIPHPDTTHDHYKMWEAMTQYVRNTIITMFGSNLIERLPPSPDSYRFPDKLMRQFRWAFHEPRMALAAYMNTVTLDRREFPSTSEFIRQLRRRVLKSNRFKMLITPFQATSILLSGLDDEFPVWVRDMIMSLPRGIAETMTENDFFRICHHAEIYADLMVRVRNATKPPTTLADVHTQLLLKALNDQEKDNDKGKGTEPPKTR